MENIDDLFLELFRDFLGDDFSKNDLIKIQAIHFSKLTEDEWDNLNDQEKDKYISTIERSKKPHLN